MATSRDSVSTPLKGFYFSLLLSTSTKCGQEKIHYLHPALPLSITILDMEPSNFDTFDPNPDDLLSDHSFLLSSLPFLAIDWSFSHPQTTATLQVSPTLNTNSHLCYGCNLSLDTSPMIASVSGHHKWHIDCLR